MPVQGETVVPPVSDHDVNEVSAASLLLRVEQPLLLCHGATKKIGSRAVLFVVVELNTKICHLDFPCGD